MAAKVERMTGYVAYCAECNWFGADWCSISATGRAIDERAALDEMAEHNEKRHPAAPAEPDGGTVDG